MTHEHKLVYHEAKEPTCTTDGTLEYYSCSNCVGKFDKDGNVFDASIKGGTIVEESVRQAAIAAAKKTKFNKIEGNHTQYGTITYNLKLK